MLLSIQVILVILSLAVGGEPDILNQGAGMEQAKVKASAAAAAHHQHQDMMGGMGEEDKLTYMDLDDKVSVSNQRLNPWLKVW